MTIKQLKEAIKELPDDMDVFITASDGEFTHQLVEFAGVKNVRFSDGDLEAYDDVLVISEDFVQDEEALAFI